MGRGRRGRRGASRRRRGASRRRRGASRRRRGASRRRRGASRRRRGASRRRRGPRGRVRGLPRGRLWGLRYGRRGRCGGGGRALRRGDLPCDLGPADFRRGLGRLPLRRAGTGLVRRRPGLRRRGGRPWTRGRPWTGGRPWAGARCGALGADGPPCQVVHLHCRAEAAAGLVGHRRRDDRVHRGGEVRPPAGKRHGVRALRRRPGEEVVEQRSEGVDAGAFAGGLAAQHLRRNVRRVAPAAGASKRLPGGAEVGKPRSASRHEDRLRTHLMRKDAVVSRVVERPRDVGEKAKARRRRQQEVPAVVRQGGRRAHVEGDPEPAVEVSAAQHRQQPPSAAGGAPRRRGRVARPGCGGAPDRVHADVAPTGPDARLPTGTSRPSSFQRSGDRRAARMIESRRVKQVRHGSAGVVEQDRGRLGRRARGRSGRGRRHRGGLGGLTWGGDG
jgi:hypothetical protein